MVSSAGRGQPELAGGPSVKVGGFCMHEIVCLVAYKDMRTAIKDILAIELI